MVLGLAKKVTTKLIAFFGNKQLKRITNHEDEQAMDLCFFCPIIKNTVINSQINIPKLVHLTQKGCIIVQAQAIIVINKHTELIPRIVWK